MKTTSTRPKNGCARCIWWRYHESGWGRCKVLSGSKTWYQHAPCLEYEINPLLSDTIIVNQSN